MVSAMGMFLLGQGELCPPGRGSRSVRSPLPSPEMGLVPLGMLPAGLVLPPLPCTLPLRGGYH